MAFFIFIHFLVFAGCILSQFVFLRRVRVGLIERHPEVWRDLSLKAWSVDSAVGRYVWRNTKALNDPLLDKAILQLRLLYGLGFIAWLSFPIMIVTTAIIGRR